MANYTENLNLILPDKSENYDVNVANTNNKIIDAQINNKVDKIIGKGLSTHDFTSQYKRKLDTLQSVYNFKDSVATQTELLTIEEKNIGDVYNVIAESKNYGWNGTEWVPLGITLNTENLATQEYVDEKNAEQDAAMTEMQSTLEEDINTKSSIKRSSGNMYESKWYRFAKLGGYSGLGLSFILNIWTRYSSTNNSAFTLSINVTHNVAKITQISGLENSTHVIDKIRVVKDTSDNNAYLEVYYGVDSKNNTFYAEIFSNANITMLGLTDTTETVTVLDELDLSGNNLTSVGTRTGRYRNGKPEYVKTLSIASLPNNTTGSYPHGLTNVTFLRIEGMTTGETQIPINCPRQSVASSICAYRMINEIRIETGMNRSTLGALIDIYYIEND